VAPLVPALRRGGSLGRRVARSPGLAAPRGGGGDGHHREGAAHRRAGNRSGRLLLRGSEVDGFGSRHGGGRFDGLGHVDGLDARDGLRRVRSAKIYGSWAGCWAWRLLRAEVYGLNLLSHWGIPPPVG